MVGGCIFQFAGDIRPEQGPQLGAVDDVDAMAGSQFTPFARNTALGHQQPAAGTGEPDLGAQLNHGGFADTIGQPVFAGNQARLAIFQHQPVRTRFTGRLFTACNLRQAALFNQCAADDVDEIAPVHIGKVGQAALAFDTAAGGQPEPCRDQGKTANGQDKGNKPGKHVERFRQQLGERVILARSGCMPGVGPQKTATPAP